MFQALITHGELNALVNLLENPHAVHPVWHQAVSRYHIAASNKPAPEVPMVYSYLQTGGVRS